MGLTLSRRERELQDLCSSFQRPSALVPFSTPNSTETVPTGDCIRVRPKLDSEVIETPQGREFLLYREV